METLSISDGPEGRCIRLSGELDYVGYLRLAEPFRRAIAGCDRVVVDFSEVTYVSSYAIRLLLEAHRRLARTGGSISVRRLSPFARKVFTTTGLTLAVPEV